jgi:hypothetical protein
MEATIYKVAFADKGSVDFEDCQEALDYALNFGYTLLSAPLCDRYLPIKVIKVETEFRGTVETVFAVWTRQTLALTHNID